MSKHVDLAKELFEKGYSCSQAVFAAFSDETGLNMETSLKLASSFGGGMGRLREVCGAVTAMFMVVGLKYGYTDPQNPELKDNHYKIVQDLASKFKEQNGSLLCRELLELNVQDESAPENNTGKKIAHLPQCFGYVVNAAKMLDEFIQSHDAGKKAE